MKKMKFKIGDIVWFGMIQTVVTKLTQFNDCERCALYKVCNALLEIYGSDGIIMDEFNKMTGLCTAIDANGEKVYSYFKEVKEKPNDKDERKKD